MAEFRHQDLSGSRFERVDLTGSRLRWVDLSNAHINGVALQGVTIQGAEIADTRISGDVESLFVNGVDVVPFVEAELDRLEPERRLMRPADAAGFRAAWDVVERLWAGTVERARGLDPGLLHESVEGEWSFVETLRHLLFVTDAWVRRSVLGDPAPWDPLDLPWDDMEDSPGVPRDRQARPSLDEVLALRRDRMATVRALVDAATDASLDEPGRRDDGPGWPPPGQLVRKCLQVVLNEEWHHRKYAERDLDVLALPSQGAGAIASDG